MKTLFLVLLSVISFSVYSDELTTANLEGTWEIMPQSADEEDLGEHLWIFRDGQFQIMAGGRTVGRAEPYRVDGSSIVYSTPPWEVTMNVTSFTGTTMTVNTMGSLHETLRKVD